MNSLFEFEPGLFFWQAVILLTTFFILGKFAWKPILRFMHNQEQAYAEVAQQAEEQLERAKTLAHENEHMLIRAKEQRQHMLQEAFLVKKDLLDKAKQEALRIREAMITQARENILHEKEAAVKVLKKQIGMLGIQLAEKLLEQELSEGNKQEILLQRLIAEASATNTISSHTLSSL